MFSSSIQHYIIWIDKCHLLVHIIVEIHPFGILDELSLSPSATSSSSPWFNDGLLFQEPAPIVQFPENLAMSFRRYVSHLFFSDILSLRYHDTNRIWISVRYDGWNIFARVITLVLIWPGKVMSCLAHLAGGPIIIISFARITILPGENCKTYSISCSWWILWVSKVWSSPDDHVNAISKHVGYTLIFQQEHLKPNAKCFLLNYPNTVVWVMSWNSVPSPRGFSTLYPDMDIMLCLSLGRI